jgi:hypothetical protein
MNFIVYFYVFNDENENYPSNSRFFTGILSYYGVNSNFNVKFFENIMDMNTT